MANRSMHLIAFAVVPNSAWATPLFGDPKLPPREMKANLLVHVADSEGRVTGFRPAGKALSKAARHIDADGALAINEDAKETCMPGDREPLCFTPDDSTLIVRPRDEMRTYLRSMIQARTQRMDAFARTDALRFLNADSEQVQEAMEACEREIAERHGHAAARAWSFARTA